MKKLIAFSTVLTLTIGISPAFAADFVSPPAISEELLLNDIKEFNMADMPDMDILSTQSNDFGIMSLSADENPSVSSVEQAVLTGDVNGGKITSDGKSIEFDNGESASVYTVTIDPGSYTINGFCASCVYEDDAVIKDFYIPNVSGGSVTVNIIVNRPNAEIKIGTLKSDGKDAFDGTGAPYTYEIVDGNASDWRLDETGHYIEEYIGETTDNLVIPNRINGKTILGVMNDTLINDDKIGTIFGECTIKGNTLSVNQKASSVTISEGIKILGSFMFCGCDKLTGSIEIPSSVTAIGPYAFYGCSGFTGGLDISSCRKIYPYAFFGCTGLSGELKLSGKLTEIPRGAFVDCPFSGALNIPEGVTDIGYFAFGLFNQKATSFSSLSLPSTLKRIGAVAFQYQTRMSNELVLPEGLTHIGDFAFDHCRGFTNTSLTIPASVETIGGDLAVEKGTGEANTGYGGHVFYDAFHKSTEFKVGAGSKHFKAENGVLFSIDGTRLVSYPINKNDTEYTIPDGVTQIDEMALGYSKAQTFTLPNSFKFNTEVPENIINQSGNNLAVAFYAENDCKSVQVHDSNESYKSENGVIYSKDGKELWYVPLKYGSVEIADGCTTIKSGAFFGRSYRKDWETIYIPASVTMIEKNTLDFLNTYISGSQATVTIDKNNTVYTVTNGKIVKK